MQTILHRFSQFLVQGWQGWQGWRAIDPPMYALGEELGPPMMTGGTKSKSHWHKKYLAYSSESTICTHSKLA